MKKLIILFILSITTSSCSNDDNTANTTPLEGKWYTSNVAAIEKADFKHSSSSDISDKIIMQFTNNNYIISPDLDFSVKGIFTYEQDNDYTFVKLIPENSDYTISTYYIEFNNDRTRVTFYSVPEPSIYFELTKIQ